MDDDILIEVKLDDREITRQMDNISRKLQKSLDAAVGRPTGGGQDRVTKTFKDQEAAALKLAQAQARLATASGDLSRAENTLSTALAGVNKQTITSISAQTQLAQVHQRMARTLKEMAENLTNIGSRLTIGLTAPLGALAIAAIKTATDFDSLKRGLIAVSGSSAEAEKQLTRLKEVAKLPGLGFKEAIQGSINLQAAGFSAERAERSLKAFGNALAIIGKGKAELSGVILALSQIESKGKVSAEEINQLAERVPQIRKAMIAAFGTADTEVIQKAKITSGKFIDAVLTQLEKLPKATGGARNEFENLKDSIEQALLPLGNKLLSTILPAIERITPKLLGLVEGFQKLSPAAQNAAVGFGVAAFAAGPLIGALGNILSLLVQIRNLGGIGSVLGGLGTLGKVGLAGAAVGGVGAAIFMAARDATTPAQASRDAGAVPADITRRVNERTRQQLALGQQIKGFADSILTPGQAKPVPDSPIIDAKKLAAENAKRHGQKSELDKARDEVKQLTQKVAALGNAESALGVELAKIDVLRAQAELGEKARKDAAQKEAKRQLGIPLAPVLPNLTLGVDQRGKPIPFDVAARGVPLTAALGNAGGIAGAATVGASDLEADRLRVAQNRQDLAEARLRIQEVQIQNQVNRGLLTEADAQRQLNAARRASRDELIASLEAQLKVVDANSIEGLQIIEQIERVRNLGVELSNTERFMKGFGSATETVGDAFDRFGQNVARAFGNIRNLFDGLKQAVLQFFNDLAGNALQNLVRNTLGGLFGNLGGALGGVFGGAGGGNIFRTPSTFGNFAQAFAGAGGGGLSAPPSISGGSIPLPSFLLGGGGGGSSPLNGQFTLDPVTAAELGIGKPSFFGSLGKSFAAAAPFLGLSLGGSLGGQSLAGSILGSGGGFLAGGAVAGFSGLLGTAATAFFTNPFTIAIGAGLLVGGLLLGKAKQRKKDEEASGEFLRQALAGIDQLAAGIVSDQVDGAQARAIFDSQILGSFRQQISGLRTPSVVKSRLANQMRDLENVYQARIPPLIAEQQQRRATQASNAAAFSRQIPEFAIGGLTRGGLAILHPNEMVLTPNHQMAVRAIGGPDIFDRVGVPGIRPDARFDNGGIMPSSQSGGQVIVIEELHIDAVVDAEGITIRGMRSDRGRAVTVKNIKDARTNREL